MLDAFETEPVNNLGFIGVAAGSFPTVPILRLRTPRCRGRRQRHTIGARALSNSPVRSARGLHLRARGTGPSTDNWDLNFVVTEIPAVRWLFWGYQDS